MTARRRPNNAANTQATCRVDGRPILSGGSKADQLCARCYQRARRGSALTTTALKLPPGEGADLPPVRVSRRGLAMVERLAQAEGVTLTEWLRAAVSERAKRQGGTEALWTEQVAKKGRT